jgi:hypothetical protein
MGNNRLRSQIENLKYDRDLLIQESKTFRGILNRQAIQSKIEIVENKIRQLQMELDMWSHEPGMPDNTLYQLHQKLVKYFDDKEIRLLCFHLGIDYDEVVGEGKGDTLRRLILYVERRGHIDQLISVCKQSRPTVVW